VRLSARCFKSHVPLKPSSRSKNDGPRFRRGHAVGLGFAIMAVILSLILTLSMQRENRRRDALFGPPKAQDDGVDGLSTEKDQEQLKAWGLEGKTEDEIVALGDR
jgi:hypothetical protein